MKLIYLLCASVVLSGGSLGFSMESPREFARLPTKERSIILEKTWNDRVKIMQELESNGYENPEKEFFHVYHQMLIIDNECLQKENSSKKK